MPRIQTDRRFCRFNGIQTFLQALLRHLVTEKSLCMKGSRIGEEQNEEDAHAGPPEMLFLHSGHTAKVEDLSFRKGDGWLCATVSDDNIVQVWQMSRKLYEMDVLGSSSSKKCGKGLRFGFQCQFI